MNKENMAYILQLINIQWNDSSFPKERRDLQEHGCSIIVTLC